MNIEIDCMLADCLVMGELGKVHRPFITMKLDSTSGKVLELYVGQPSAVEQRQAPHSARGKGRIERLFGSLNHELGQSGAPLSAGRLAELLRAWKARKGL